MRFWIGWWGGSGGDCRPLVDDDDTPAWACSGEREGEPQFSLCAVVEASKEKRALEQIERCWPECELRFCHQKPDGWLPGDRFRCIEERLRAR